MPVTAPPQQPITTVVSSRSELASRGVRLTAAILDTAIAMVFYLVAMITNMPMIMFVGVLALFVYQCYLLATHGQTIGKQICSIKIVTIDNGTNGGFMTNVLKRTILNGIFSLVPLYALVDVFCIFREDRRCLHDLIAGTRVVRA